VAYRLVRDAQGRPEIVREDLAVESEEPLAVELRSFLERVRGKAAACVTAEEGLRALRVATQILSQIGGPES
jgi:predicted dehydrogenase